MLKVDQRRTLRSGGAQAVAGIIKFHAVEERI
jgi:hypothetical protein